MITTTCLILWMFGFGAVGRFTPLDAAPPDATMAAQSTTPKTRLTPCIGRKASRDLVRGHVPGPGPASGQRRHVHVALARAVELAEEDPLPRPEREASVVQRDEHLRPHQRRADVRGRVLLALLDVLPAPV